MDDRTTKEEGAREEETTERTRTPERVERPGTLSEIPSRRTNPFLPLDEDETPLWSTDVAPQVERGQEMEQLHQREPEEEKEQVEASGGAKKKVERLLGRLASVVKQRMGVTPPASPARSASPVEGDGRRTPPLQDVEEQREVVEGVEVRQQRVTVDEWRSELPPAAPSSATVEVQVPEDQSIRGDDSEARGSRWETSLPHLLVGGRDVPPPIPARTPGWERERERQLV